MQLVEILVIEDEPVIQQTLETFLDASDYCFKIVGSGPEAFGFLKENLPELILCDVMMPGMTGFEVCQKLKEQAAWQEIPLIFLTALSHPDQIVQGLKTGAVDYVTKPFNFSELSARIKTHLELARSRQQLKSYATQLEQLHQKKDQFLGIAAHDLKNPLATVILRAEMTIMKAKTISPEKIETAMNLIREDAQRMLDIVTHLLDINLLESGKLEVKPERCDLNKLLGDMLTTWQDRASVKQITLIPLQPEQEVWLWTDNQILIQIVENLLSNAVKYSPPNRRVWFGLHQEASEVFFEVRDEGPGLTSADQEKLFQQFARLSARPTGGESSTGLGLSIVKFLVEQLKGRIWCQSQPGQGASFFVALPLEGITV